MNNFYNPPFMNSGYTPYFNPYQQQTMQGNMQQPYTNLIYVSGVDDVKTRVVPNGSTMIFADNDKPMIYKKTVDNKGQYTIDVYDIVPHKEEAKTEPKDYVSKSEFETVEKKIGLLEKTMATLIPTKKEVTTSGNNTIR